MIDVSFFNTENFFQKFWFLLYWHKLDLRLFKYFCLHNLFFIFNMIEKFHPFRAFCNIFVSYRLIIRSFVFLLFQFTRFLLFNIQLFLLDHFLNNFYFSLLFSFHFKGEFFFDCLVDSYDILFLFWLNHCIFNHILV